MNHIRLWTERNQRVEIENGDNHKSERTDEKQKK